jgi:pantetheine-phosphate adenylyltransferase/dephospho-CoA kinase
MTTAIYAFSGDPITYGHINIINRARTVFDQVIVAIGKNPDKKYTFNLRERKEMAKRCFSDPSIRVLSFSNLLVDFAYEQGASVIIKGVRNSADFDYESILHSVGQSQKVGIDTHILFADPKLAHISSSTVKAIAQHNGEIHEYVPLHVKQAVEERVCRQIIIGVTGEICSGKSHICNMLSRYQCDTGGYQNIHNIELDHIGHDILTKLTEPSYVQVRKEIGELAPISFEDDGFIDRSALGAIVFNNPDKLKKLNEIMAKSIMIRLRKEISGKTGIILINCALLVEAQMLHTCNNNVILIKVDTDTQRQRLLDRGLTEEQIETRMSSQYSYDCKEDKIRKTMKQHQHGSICIIDNSNNITKEELYKEFTELLNKY